LASATREVGLITPEINLARRLISKYSLKPPIKIIHLAKNYASVESLEIPFDVDGITIKLRGTVPRILLNSLNTNLRRKRFTLAHELGHVIIPWHFGTIIDDDTELIHLQDHPFEAEANRFASELLMPSAWLQEIVNHFDDPETMIDGVVEGANVSFQAAIIRTIAFLPPGLVYAQMSDVGKVISSGRSPNTPVYPPEWGKRVDPASLYPFSEDHFSFRQGGSTYFWWRFPDRVKIDDIGDPRDWREILNTIVQNIGVPQSGRSRFKQSINGIIANRHALEIRNEKPSAEALMAACLTRLRSNPELELFVAHGDLETFLSKRVTELSKKWQVH
jgi:hypothetical protein